MRKIPIWLLVMMWLGGFFLGIGIGKNWSPRWESNQKADLVEEYGTATVTFEDGYIVPIGTSIENINSGKISTVSDIVESFNGSTVYILDNEDRWSENLIKKHWRKIPEIGNETHKTIPK